MTYKMITPDEPPIGTVVRAGIGFTWSRTEKGWENSNGTLFTWSELLADGEELEDITPLRTWAQPVEPPVGTRVKDCAGDIWTRSEGGWATAPGGGAPWRSVLHYAPLIEIRD